METVNRRWRNKWAQNDLVLGKGEIGQEIDTARLKVGDGITPWSQLSFLPGSSAGNEQPGGSGGPVSSESITDASFVGKTVLTAPDGETARNAIGAGTSNLTIGTGSTNAKRGDYVPTYAEMGVVPTSALPSLVINDVYTVASQAEMLGLLANRGDMAIRTDNGNTYVLASASPSTLADWKQVTSAGSVSSVAGKTGVVSLVKSDVGLTNVDNTSDANKPVSTATQTALDGKLGAADLVPVNPVLSVNNTQPDSNGNVTVAGGGGSSSVASSDITDSTAVGRSVLTAATQAAARSAIGVTAGGAASITEQTMIDVTGLALTGEPTSTGFFPTQAPRVKYARNRPRLIVADNPSKFVREAGIGDAKGLVSLVTGRNSSPSPTGHVKFTDPGFNGTRWMAKLDTPSDIRNAYVRYNVKVTSLANVRWIRLIFATSEAEYRAGNYVRHVGLSATSNWLRPFFISDAAHPALMAVTGTGADFSSIGYIGIDLASTAANTSFDFELSFMEPIPTASTKAKVVICHDDSTNDGFGNFVRYMQEYNFPGVEASMLGTINSSTGNSFENINEARSAQYQHGWQFASHSADFDGHGDVDDASIYSQAMRNRAVSQSLGLTGLDDFTWWGGLSANEANYKAIRRAYRSGRWNTSGITVPEMLPPSDPWMMKSILVGSENLAAWKALVDAAVLVNGMAIFTFHAYIGSDTAANAKQFRAFLNYLDSMRDKVDVVTIEEALASVTSYPTKATLTQAALTPTKPTASVVSAFGSGNVTSQVNSRYATYFQVFRGTTAGVVTTGTPYATTDSMEKYVDTAVTAGTTYFYKFIAANGNGFSASSDEYSTVASATGSNTPVSEAFASTPTGWSKNSDYPTNPTTTGTWAADAGALKLTGGPTAAPANYWFISPYVGSATNEYAQATLTAAATSTTPSLPRVVINYSDAKNLAYATFVFTSGTIGSWRIYDVVDGVTTIRAQGAEIAVPTLPVVVRIQRSGTTYTLKVNGTTVLTYGGATLTGVGTGVGMRSGGGAAAQLEAMRLDDFSSDVVA